MPNPAMPLLTSQVDSLLAFVLGEAVEGIGWIYIRFCTVPVLQLLHSSKIFNIKKGTDSLLRTIDYFRISFK
jgi:hypothetical protein